MFVDVGVAVNVVAATVFVDVGVAVNVVSATVFVGVAVIVVAATVFVDSIYFTYDNLHIHMFTIQSCTFVVYNALYV